jgi:hypothetical protein
MVTPSSRQYRVPEPARHVLGLWNASWFEGFQLRGRPLTGDAGWSDVETFVPRLLVVTWLRGQDPFGRFRLLQLHRNLQHRLWSHDLPTRPLLERQRQRNAVPEHQQT